MIDNIVLMILISAVVVFTFVWLCFIPFVIVSISNNLKRSADESEKIRHTLDDIEKELEQLSKSIKK